MADEIGVMNAGQLLQWDSAYHLYHHPVHRFVGNFIGQGVMLSGTVADKQTVITDLGRINGATAVNLNPGTKVDVLVRPDDVCLDDSSPINATVTGKVFRGAEYLYTLELPIGTKVLCLTPSHRDLAIGQRLGIRVAVEDLAIFQSV